MKQSILVTALLGAIFALSACSSTSQQQVQEDLGMPINCATAEGDIRALNAEKTHAAGQLAAGVAAISPIGLVVNTATGNEDEKMSMATGDYNDKLDQKISQIKAKCGL